MRLIISAFVFFICLMSFGQNQFQALDTIGSKAFDKNLYNEYKLKYTSYNKSLDGFKSNQRKVIKELYSNNQKDFLEKIHDNNYISDKGINTYLQELLNEILNANAIDPKDYKILLSKDSEINAHNTGDGTVVVNYGMFLTVENEDELVFVLSHEVGHQYLNHVKKEIEAIAALKNSEEIVKKTEEIRSQKYSKATAADNLLKNIYYKSYRDRREKEIEADSIGFNLYKKTTRDLNHTISLLKKLDDSNQEQDSLIVADYKFCFENGDFKLKSKYFETSQSLFQKYDYKSAALIDSLKTHPDCSARIQLINKRLVNPMGNAKNSDYFIKTKKNSTYQNLLNLFSNKEYGTCLYESLKLYKKNKSDSELKRIIYLTLNEIVSSKKNYTISKYINSVDYKYNTDSENRFIDFINNIKISDLEIILTQFKS